MTLDSNEASNDSLSQLESNFRNSLNESCDNLTQSYNNLGSVTDTDPTPLSMMRSTESSENMDFYSGFLSRNSSLIDLAMLAPIDEAMPIQCDEDSNDFASFGFIDFPNPDAFNFNLSSENGKSEYLSD